VSETPVDPAEGPTTVRRGSGVDAPLLLDRLAAEVPFGLVGRILPTSLKAELRLQLHPLDHSRALELLRDAGLVADTELASSGSGGAVVAELEHESASARDLSARVARREQELYRVGLSLHALAPSPRRAERLRSEVARRAEALGLGTRRPLYEASLASAPPSLDGDEPRPAGYWHTLHSDGVAAFFPFQDEAICEPGGVLVGLLLDDAAPVFLDRFAHASHSWGVFGTTGSGKSFFAALTALRTLWTRPDVDLTVLDPLGEFGPLVERLGGHVVRLAPDGDSRLNPLDPSTTGGDLDEKSARAAVFLRTLFPSVTDDDLARLDASLRVLFDRGGEPTFADLARVVADRPGGERLATLLEVFRVGSLRYLNGRTRVDWETGPIAIDLSGATDDQLAFHLAYTLDAVYGRLRRRSGPKLVLVDEAHLLARDPATAAFLDRVVRHVRHFDAGLLLVSQNPDDFLATEHGRSLLRNLRASVFLRLPEVSPAAREFFHLTDAEAEWLPRARLPREAGYSEGLLRHGPAHLPLAIVASTAEYDLLASAGRESRPSGA